MYQLVIQCSAGSCCMHITDGIKIYLCLCVILLVPLCAVCVCVWYQTRVLPKNHVICVKPSVNVMPSFIKHTALRYHGAGTNVTRLNKFRSIISLRKIKHHLWPDDTFSLKKERGREEGVDKIWKSREREALIKYGRLRNPVLTLKALTEYQYSNRSD